MSAMSFINILRKMDNVNIPVCKYYIVYNSPRF